MSRVDVPGLMLVLAVSGSLLGLMWAPAPPAADGARPVLTYRATEALPVGFLVPIGTKTVQLITMAEQAERAATAPGAAQLYEVDAVWLDDEGHVVSSQRIELSSGSSEPPAVIDMPPGASVGVLDPRTTMLSVPSGDVVELSVRVPPNGLPLRTKAFRQDEVPLGSAELAMLSLEGKDTRRLARRLGVPWSEVTPEEARALAAHRWQSMGPRRAAIGAGSMVTHVPDPPVDAAARRASGLHLSAGRGAGWTLKGPFEVVLLARGDLSDLVVESFVEDVGAVTPQVTRVRAPEWAEHATAVRVAVEAEGEVSLLVRKPGDASLDDLLLVSHSPRVLLPDVEAVPLSTWRADLTGFSVAPLFRRLRLWRPDVDLPLSFWLEDSPVADVARLTVRPVLRAKTLPTEGEVVLDVVVRLPSGDEKVHAVRIPWIPAVYERLGDVLGVWQEDAWVGEPISTYLPLPAHAERVEVHVRPAPSPEADQQDTGLPATSEVRAEAWASLHRPGAPQGTRAYRDETGLTVRRYGADSKTDWVRLEPVGQRRLKASEREAFLWAVPRREARQEAGSETREWTRIAPVSGGERVWLSQEEALDGVVYCAVDAGGPVPSPWRDAGAERFGGSLQGYLWAPGARRRQGADAEAAILLDGVPWKRRTLHTPVTPVYGRAAPSGRMELLAPPGTRLWVRALAQEGLPCPTFVRARTVHRLSPGERATWEITKSMARQWTFIGGVADAPTELAVSVVPSGRARQAVPDWTLRSRRLALEPLEDRQAVLAENPWVTSTLLDGTGVLLREDLPAGTVRLDLTNLSDHPVELFVLQEGADDTPETLKVMPR